MSAVLRTLAELRAGVARTADVNIASSGVRHTNALVDLDINRSIARWYRMVADCGDNTYATSASIATTPFPGNAKVINIGTAFLYIRGIELVRPSGTPASLQPGDFAERNEMDGQVESDTIVGFPLYYKPGSGVTGTTPVYSVRIFPAADAVYTGLATIIPPAPVLSSDSHVIEVFAGGDEWIMKDAALAILQHDGHEDASPALMAALRADLATLARDLRFLLGTRNPIRKIDTRGIERRNRYGVRSRW